MTGCRDVNRHADTGMLTRKKSMKSNSAPGKRSPEAFNIRYVAAGLNRPECVLATASGNLYTSDWTRGIARISPDGAVSGAVDPSVIERKLLPNGFAMTRELSFLFANLGEDGGVWSASREKPAQPFLMEADGRKIPPANFVWIDPLDRIWITVSALTRSHPYFSRNEKEGFIVLVDRGSARIVADGLTWTNELRMSPDRRYLYVNETVAGRTARYRVADNGDLHDKFDIQMPPGTFPDGMAVDQQGGIWTICVVSGRLVRIDPSGSFEIVLEDFEQSKIDALCAAFPAGEVTRDLIVASKGKYLDNPSSIAFGGKDRKTLYMGSISASRLVAIDLPVAGLKPAHWEWA